MLKYINTINNIITQITQSNMKKSVSTHNLENLNVLLLTYSYINPTLLINNPEIKLEQNRFYIGFLQAQLTSDETRLLFYWIRNLKN